LLFMEMGVDRAYVYFFNDDDTPQLHGSSGLTRKFVPKPAFHALAHLQSVLGDYRFSRVVGKHHEVLAYEFISGKDPKDVVWVMWMPTPDTNFSSKYDVNLEGLAFRSAERTPLSQRRQQPVEVDISSGVASLYIGGAPLFLRLRKP
jgi:hypothetical protein